MLPWFLLIGACICLAALMLFDDEKCLKAATFCFVAFMLVAAVMEILGGW